MALLYRNANDPNESDIAVLDEYERLTARRILPGFKEQKAWSDQQFLNKARENRGYTIYDQIQPSIRPRDKILEELNYIDMRIEECRKELEIWGKAPIEEGTKIGNMLPKAPKEQKLKEKVKYFEEEEENFEEGEYSEYPEEPAVQTQEEENSEDDNTSEYSKESYE